MLGSASTSATVRPSDSLLLELVTRPSFPGPANRSARALRHDPSVQALAQTGDEGLLAALLDEVPIMLVIAEGARRRLLGRDLESTEEERAQDSHLIDVCAGWAAGGAMVSSTMVDGPLFLGHGPPAVSPVSESSDDMHAMRDLAIGNLRRLRRIDLTPAADSSQIVIDAYYRDSFVESSGIETTIHEYGVMMEVERQSAMLIAVEASAHVLPGPDCPRAAASATMLAGVALAETRPFVEQHLRGTIGCTHLNDTLRMCGTVVALIGLL
ncbi:MAG: DUF2889 domain-containing protein [Acidimicrobiia bacterium]